MIFLVVKNKNVIYNTEKLVWGLESNPKKIRCKFIQIEYNMYIFNKKVRFFWDKQMNHPFLNTSQLFTSVIPNSKIQTKQNKELHLSNKSDVQLCKIFAFICSSGLKILKIKTRYSLDILVKL